MRHGDSITGIREDGVSHYSPGQYGHEPMIDPLHFALYRAWQHFARQKHTAMEWIRSGAPVPTERPEVIAEDLYRKKFNLAPRRL